MKVLRNTLNSDRFLISKSKSKREMKPSLRMLMIEAGIKRLIPQIVSVGKRKLPECPFLAQVQRLGDSKYQGEGVHTELYFSQKQPRNLRKMLI